MTRILNWYEKHTGTDDVRCNIKVSTSEGDIYKDLLLSDSALTDVALQRGSSTWDEQDISAMVNAEVPPPPPLQPAPIATEPASPAPSTLEVQAILDEMKQLYQTMTQDREAFLADYGKQEIAAPPDTPLASVAPDATVTPSLTLRDRLRSWLGIGTTP